MKCLQPRGQLPAADDEVEVEPSLGVIVQPTEPHKSIRELIAELAQLEDRARQVPAMDEAPDPTIRSTDPELLELARREKQVIAALRRQRPVG